MCATRGFGVRWKLTNVSHNVKQVCSAWSSHVDYSVKLQYGCGLLIGYRNEGFQCSSAFENWWGVACNKISYFLQQQEELYIDETNERHIK